MKKPILSIVVPTKNRSFTLNDLVKYFLTCDLSEVEIIIEDNSDEINCYLYNLNYSGIIYIHCDAKRTMVENCEIAISRATGDFISMIGDDDGIDLDLTLNILLKNNYDFYLSPNCKYFWPGLNRKIYGKRNFGFESNYDFEKAREIIPSVELDKVLSIGGVDILQLPRLYQGVVRRSCLNKIKDVTGYYFNAPMPDMSSSAALACFCSTGYLHNVPFIVNGVSGNSGGGLGAQGKHVGKLENAYALTSQQLLNWPSEVPHFWSGCTVWSASLIITLQKLGHQNLLNKINANYIYSYIIAYHLISYYLIHGFSNLRIGHIIFSVPLLINRVKALLHNISIYINLLIGFGLKSQSISEYLSLFKRR